MVLERTGITKTELRRLQQRGFARIVKRNSKNWGLYDESVVDEIARVTHERPVRFSSVAASAPVDYSSAEAVSVIKLLRAGRTLEDALIETELHPAVVLAIAKDHQHVAGSILLLPAQVESLNRLPFDGPRPIRTAEELVGVLESAASEVSCSACKRKQRSTLCASCIRDQAASTRARAPSAE